jgi:hypothetical protein
LTWRHKTPVCDHIAPWGAATRQFLPACWHILAGADVAAEIAGKTRKWAWHGVCCVLAAELRAGPPLAPLAFELETMSWVSSMH